MITSIAYLDDMLLVAKTKQEAIQARDSVIFLLLNLGFTINREKSVLEPTQIMEFLGMTINSREMTVSLPGDKVYQLKNLCKTARDQENLKLRELASLIGKSICNSTCSDSSTTTIKVLATESNNSATSEIDLRKRGQTLHTEQSGVAVVAKQSRPGEGEANSPGSSRDDNLLRRVLGNRLECSTRERNLHRGDMDYPRKTETSHQRAGTSGSRNSNKNIHQREKSFTDSYIHRQYDNPLLFAQNGRHEKSNSDTNIKTNMGTPVQTWDHDYCVVETDTFKHKGETGGHVRGRTPASGNFRSTFSKEL